MTYVIQTQKFGTLGFECARRASADAKDFRVLFTFNPGGSITIPSVRVGAQCGKELTTLTALRKSEEGREGLRKH
jgi:hypothetical protein